MEKSKLRQLIESARKNEDNLEQLDSLALHITHNGQQKFSEQELARRIKELCSPSTSENDIKEVAKKHASESAQKNEAWDAIKRNPKYIGDDKLAKYIMSKNDLFKKIDKIAISDTLTMSSHGNIQKGGEHEVWVYGINKQGEKTRDNMYLNDKELLKESAQKNEAVDSGLFNKKTKQAAIRYIYDKVNTKGIFRDTDWSGFRKVVDQIRNLGVDVIVGATNDSWHKAGYAVNKDNVPTEKRYDIEIIYKNVENKDIHIKGQIACQAAGSVKDPLDAYDIVMTLF